MVILDGHEESSAGSLQRPGLGRLKIYRNICKQPWLKFNGSACSSVNLLISTHLLNVKRLCGSRQPDLN